MIKSWQDDQYYTHTWWRNLKLQEQIDLKDKEIDSLRKTLREMKESYQEVYDLVDCLYVEDNKLHGVLKQWKYIFEGITKRIKFYL